MLVFLLSFFACQEKKIENSKKNTEVEKLAEEVEITEVPDIEGTYIYESNSDINEKAVLTISENNQGFIYNLKTSARNVSGKISITDEDGSTYLTLEGIKWDEYLGDVSKEMDSGSETEDTIQENEPEIKIPVGIGALLDVNEIVIQNGGNSMNYYVKLGEIDEKYIHFVKQ